MDMAHERIDTAEKPGRLMDLMHSCSIVVNKCLSIQTRQTVLIVADTEVSPMVYHSMAAAVHMAGGTPTLAIMRPLPHANAEPPATVAAAMKEADATIAMLTLTMTHTRAREIATQEYKRRYLLMPAVTEDMLMRGASLADFEIVKNISMLTAKALSRGKRIRVTSPHGTDLTVCTEGRPFRAYYGECIKAGDVSLFPGGEANTLPVENSANGVVIYDSYMMGVGLLDTPIAVEFKDGLAVSITGGREADQLKRILEKTGSVDSYRLGELAVGTNYEARTIGSAFEDKQVYGTAHIALGSGVAWPRYYRPNYHAPIHLDGVLSRPTVEVDGVVVVHDGEILVAPRPGHARPAPSDADEICPCAEVPASNTAQPHLLANT